MESENVLFCHRRSQEFFLVGGGHPADATLASVVHMFEAVAGSWRSVSRVMTYESSPRAEKNG